MTYTWYDMNTDRVAYKSKVVSNFNAMLAGDKAFTNVKADVCLMLKDAVSAPNTVAGYAQIYVDVVDGDLKVKFGDGTVKTIVADT